WAHEILLLHVPQDVVCDLQRSLTATDLQHLLNYVQSFQLTSERLCKQEWRAAAETAGEW
ncbi:hypothetical protein JZ751_004703, partial [Albula glossodonta]